MLTYAVTDPEVSPAGAIARGSVDTDGPNASTDDAEPPALTATCGTAPGTVTAASGDSGGADTELLTVASCADADAAEAPALPVTETVGAPAVEDEEAAPAGASVSPAAATAASKAFTEAAVTPAGAVWEPDVSTRAASTDTDAVGDGCYHLVVAASVNGDSLAIGVPLHNRGEETDLDPDDAVEAMMLLTLAASVGGGAVLCTDFADGTSRVRGWRLVEFYARPLNAAEVFNAYCVDGRTGELIAPEWVVEYVAAPRLKV
ncbi:hypothetical protein ACFU5Y_25580 [Streptomyces gardneri]|uniref:hypothetical protein n=1 Tax=Streptomyces gardneri TaxID=66892 RepID=UPI0036C53C10